MKRTRTMIALVLLFALLLSSCGLRSPLAEVDTAQTAVEAPQEAPQAPAAAEEAASDEEPFAQALSTVNGQPDPVSVEKTGLFAAKFEGSDVEGTAEAVDGVYRFSAAKTDGEAWHVKLESNYPTVAGRDYRVTYRFRSDVAGKVKFGDFQEFEIEEGENTVTGIAIAAGGTSYLDLQLGMLPPFTIDFTEIEVKEYADVADYEDALAVPVNFEKESKVYEKHDQGYAAILERSSDKVDVNYVATSWEEGIWKSRLYVRTGLVPEKGVRYRITADLTADQDFPFELLLNNGDEEKGYGALYGQSIAAGETTSCEAVIVGGSEGDELVLQFSLGMVPEGSIVKVGNLHIDKIIDHYTSELPAAFALDRVISTGKTIYTSTPVSYTPIPLEGFSYSGTDTVWEGHDDGYIVSLEEGADSAVMKIEQAPAEGRGVWKAKLYAATGVVLEQGKTYRVSFDLKAAADQAKYEVCFDGSSENAYGALYDRSLTAGGTDHVEYTVTPDESLGALTLRLQLGETDSTAGNTYTFSGLKLECLEVEYEDVLPESFSYATDPEDQPEPETKSVLPEDFSYRSGVNVREQHAEGYTQSVSAEGGEATLAITAAPAEGRDLWNSRLLIDTGFVPAAGVKYMVSFDLESEKDQDKIEICFDGDAENAYGVIYDQSLVSGSVQPVSHFFTPEESAGALTLRLQLGQTNDTTGNTVKLSKLKISELSENETPVGDISYLTETNVREEHDHGIEQTLSASGSTAELKISQARGEEGGVYSSRLFIRTGVTPEAGARYRVSADVASDKALDYELVCDKGGEENGYADGKRVGLQLDAGGKETVTNEITAPESGCGELVLRFQLGESPADNRVTVSGIKVCKLTGEAEPVELKLSYPEPEEEPTEEKHSFALEALEGAEALLSGDGSSATVKVTKPGDDWHVKLYAKPGLELEKGKSYRVTMNVTNADGCEVCFKANGDETAFGSAKIASGSVSHRIVPAENGTLELVLKLGALPADTEVTVSDIKLEVSDPTASDVTPEGFAYPTVTPGGTSDGSFKLESEPNTEAAAELTGNGSSATATVTSSDGIDWHIKFYALPGLELKAGSTYQISLDVTNADGCEVCFKANGNEEAFGKTSVASGSVSHEIKPEADGTMEIILKLGTLAAGAEVKVSNVQIVEGTSAATDVLPSAFAYPVTGESSTQHVEDAWVAQSISLNKQVVADDGSAADASLGSNSAEFNITTARAGGGVWSTRLQLGTGLVLEPGAQYRVCATVSLENASAENWELVYSNGHADTGDSGCNKWGSGYGFGCGKNDQNTDLNLTFTAPSDLEEYKELVLRFQFGNSGVNKVTITNISVEKFVPAHDEEVPGTTTDNSFKLEANNGTTAVLTGDGSSATAKLTSSDGIDWHIKFYAFPNLELKTGKTYLVSLNATNADGCEVDFKANGDEKFFGETKVASGKVSHTITPTADGTMEILLKLGTLATGTKVKVSGIKLQELSSDSAVVTPEDFAYPNTTPDTVNAKSFELDANSGAEATLTGDGSSAAVTIKKHGDDWNVKLLAKPGLELEKDKSYRVTLKAQNADGCPVCFKVGDNEEALGKTSVASGSASFTVTPAENGTMEILLKLGALADGTEVTVSDIKLEELTDDFGDCTPTITYPTEAEAAAKTSSFKLEANEGAEAALSGDGSSATATVTKPGDDWHVKFYAMPGLELEKGKTYQISLDVSGAKDCQVCYKNTATGAEDGFGTETVAAASGTVTHVVTPEESGTLEILLKLGTVPAGTEVKISKIEIGELTEKEGENLMTSALRAWAPVNCWAHEDYEASLSHKASSASIKIGKAPADGREPWKVKLFVETGAKLELGRSYRISVDVKAGSELPFEICYNDGAEEKGVGALYELTATSAAQTVSYEVRPEKNAELILQFSLGNAETGSEFTVSGIEVVELEEHVEKETAIADFTAWAPVHHWADQGYKAELSNTDSSASLKISAVTADDQADWKLKLFVETGAKLEAGKNYRIRYDLEADTGFDFNVFYNNGAEEKAVGEFYGLAIEKNQTVEHVVSPGSDAELTLQLMLGYSPAGNKVTISNVQVDEILGDAPVQQHAPINFWAHEDYEASLTNTDDSASIRITKVPADGREAWKVKLFAETGAELKAGKTYRISVDTSAASDLAYEICYNNVEVEKELGALYELHAASGKQTVTFTAAPEQDAVLILQFNLGNAEGENSFTISGIKVEEVVVTDEEDLLEGFRYDSTGTVSLAADDGYITELDKADSSATLRILHAPDERNPWNVKLNVKTGLSPEKGKGYRVSFDIEAEGKQDLFEVFYDGSTEAAYGAIYQQKLSAGKKTVSYIIRPGDSKGELSIQIRLGKTDGTEGNTYTVSNLKLDEVSFSTTATPETKEVTELFTHTGYTAVLEKAHDRATVRFQKTPSTGMEPWKTKLFVETGVDLKTGQKYRVSMDVKSIIPAPFEVCFNDGAEEKGVGAIFGLISIPSGQRVEYVFYAREDAHLVIQLSLGNCSAPNNIVLGDVAVEQAGDLNFLSDTIYTF